jgi:hypothetical protein
MHTFLRSVWLFLGVLLTFTTLLSAQTEYKYSYVPKMVYQNQVFPVTIVMIDSSSHLVPDFRFDSLSSTQPIFNAPLVIQNGNDSFFTFYFKAKTKDIRIPMVYISTQNAEVTFSEQSIAVKPLQETKNFSGVLAADMKIKNAQVSNYDETNHIVSLDIEAYEANLEDMYLNEVIESGIENLKRKFAKVKAEFYVVLPMDKKVLKLSYYNTIKKQYITITVPVVVQDSSVSTQSELNPKEDNFEKLKKYALMGLSGFFILMFLFKRDFFYLVFAVISIITLLTLYIPHKKICIEEGTPLYILPMSTSSMSTKIETTFETSLLGERGDYKKVEYKKGMIGWIKNENICHN